MAKNKKSKLEPSTEPERDFGTVLTGYGPDCQFYTLTLIGDLVKIERRWCPLFTYKRREPLTDDESNQMETLTELATLHKWFIDQISIKHYL